MHGIRKVRAKLNSLCIICSLGQVKFSFYKYIMVIYLSLGKYKIVLFPHPWVRALATGARGPRFVPRVQTPFSWCQLQGIL